MRRDRSANPHSNALRDRRVSLSGHIYHLVKCLDVNLHGQVDLTLPCMAEIVTRALFYQKDQSGCRLFAFVVMPDHVHWLFALPDRATLADTAKSMFGWSAGQINREVGRKGKLWQDGYYDHLVREDETLSGLIGYIEANPVRKGLCAFATDWLWSSAHSKWQNKLDREWLGRNRFEEGRGV